MRASEKTKTNLVKFIESEIQDRFGCGVSLFLNEEHNYCKISIPSRAFAELIKENNVENKEESKRVEFKYHLEHIIEDVDSNGQKSIE